MTYILFCIVVNVLLLFIFKKLNDYDVELFNVIIINYVVCVVTGLVIVSPQSYYQVLQTSPPWIPYCVGLGFCFISGFYLVGLSSQTQGIAATSVAQRMSFLASVVFGVLIFTDEITTLKVVACTIGLAATLLIQMRPEASVENRMPRGYLLLLGVFALSSIIEMVIFYLAKKGISPPGNYYSTITIFLSAGVIGWILWFFIGKPIGRKDLIGGVVLGLPNFFSIYTLFEALNSEFQGSQVIPWINLGILVLSFIIGILLLDEKVSGWRLAGVFLAVISVILFLV